MKPALYPSVHPLSVELWNSEKIKISNEKLLADISGAANVYAIFIADKGNNEYALKYIGQTRSKYARTRLTNHLINKNENTGAKLNKVKCHIQTGGSIKISWISINPESLRHYVEEELIVRHKEELVWNEQGKKRV
ncbi:MAG: hypothetical protein Q9M82_06340 [Mariprofundus sp.]|nr:hypothetical protein [Mariprofundus sp.]